MRLHPLDPVDALELVRGKMLQTETNDGFIALVARCPWRQAAGKRDPRALVPRAR